MRKSGSGHPSHDVKNELTTYYVDDVARLLAERIKVPLKAAMPYTRLLFQILGEKLSGLDEGQRIQITGFGTWTVARRDGNTREVTNWRTGERVKMDTSAKIVLFQPSRVLKDKVNRRRNE